MPAQAGAQGKGIHRTIGAYHPALGQGSGWCAIGPTLRQAIEEQGLEVTFTLRRVRTIEEWVKLRGDADHPLDIHATCHRQRASSIR